jgi:hypothetical protein
MIRVILANLHAQPEPWRVTIVSYLASSAMTILPLTRLRFSPIVEERSEDKKRRLFRRF